MSRRRRPKPTSQSIAVRGDHITLGQLLQAAGVVSSGGEAKYWLTEHIAVVNGEPEQRRGRKLRPGDVVTAGLANIRLIAAGQRPGTVQGSGIEDQSGTEQQSTESTVCDHAGTEALNADGEEDGREG